MNNIIFKLYGQFDITYDAKFVPTRNDLEYIKFCDNLKHGYSENIIEFTPKKGTYKLTCSMGMVPPVIINVI